MYLGEMVNEHGTQVSAFHCETCDFDFTVCPAVISPERRDRWDGCLADDCGSYDPARDADVLFMTDEEIRDQKPVVALDMLAARKAGVVRVPKETR